MLTLSTPHLTCFFFQDFVCDSAPNVTYEILFPMPYAGVDEEGQPVRGPTISFENGNVTSPDGNAGAAAKAKAWAPIFGDEPTSMNPFEDEDGELKDSESVAARCDAETHKNFMTWPREQIRFLTEANSGAMCAKIPKTRKVPVEVRRITSEVKGGKGGKGKGASDEERTISYHGMALVDVGALLYPGTTSFSGAFPVFPYSEAKVTEALTGIKAPANEGEADEDGSASRSTPSVAVGKSGKDKKGKKDPAAAGIEQAAAEAVAYEEAKTYLKLNITISKPLVPKKTREEVVLDVQALIKPRELYPKGAGGADKSVADLHGHIGAIANELLDEYRKQLSAAGEAASKADVRRRMLYDLNTTGKYFAFKEKLKRAIVKVTREKFLHTSSIVDPEQKQAFLSKLYVFLVNEMHDTLGKQFAFSVGEQPAEIEINVEDTRRFAAEAESLGQRDHAATYYQECITRNNADLANWFNYGKFCMQQADFAKATKCFEECVSLNSKDVPSLMFAAVVAWKLGQLARMVTLLEAASEFGGDDAMPWALRGICLEMAEDHINSDMSFQEAGRKLGDGGAFALYERLAAFLLPCNIPVLQEKAFAFGLAAPAPNHPMWILRARYCLQQADHAEADKCLTEAEKDEITNPNVFALKGKLDLAQNELKSAQKNFERAMDLPGEVDDEHGLKMRLGAIYAELGAYDQAKASYLSAAAKSPTALTWEGVGAACYKLGDLQDAEEAFAESNIYDNTNARVWGYLALICTKTKRTVEAEQAYKYCLQCGLADEDPVKVQLKAAQAETGSGSAFLDDA